MKRLIFIFIALCFLWPFPNNSLAGSVKLPRTGQEISYAPGDDGDLKKGVIWPNPRFKDNGNGTITDNLTGLIWLKDGNCIKNKFPQYDQDDVAGDGRIFWQHALDFVKGINEGQFPGVGAGFTDWRLPNINELLSLVHIGMTDLNYEALTWLNNQGFQNIQRDNYYWSSTAGSGINKKLAWAVDPIEGYGQVFTFYASSIPPGWVYPSLYVLPVRGTTSGPAQVWATNVQWSMAVGDDGNLGAGVPWPSPRFTRNADTSMTDNLTGLIWVPIAQTPGGGLAKGVEKRHGRRRCSMWPV